MPMAAIISIFVALDALLITRHTRDAALMPRRALCCCLSLFIRCFAAAMPPLPMPAAIALITLRRCRRAMLHAH